MSGIVPVVLSAGASSRMGRPKALLGFDGKVCLELALEAVRGHDRPIVVLGPDGDAILARVPLDGARVVRNPDVDSGQTSSLRVALASLPAEAEAFFFMPVDHPLVRDVEVARVVDAYRANADPARSIFIPSHCHRRGHPVLCRREIAAEFLGLNPGEPARDVIRRDPGRILHVEDPEAYVLMDMDTPEDYVRCLEVYRARNRRGAP